MQPTNLNLKAIARDATLRGDTKTLFHALDLLERVVPIATFMDFCTELDELRLQGVRPRPHWFDSGQGRRYIPAMPRRTSKKDSAAKLAGRMKRRWRVVLLRSKGEILGTVEAPDVASVRANSLRVASRCALGTHLSTWLKRIGSRWSRVGFREFQWSIGDVWDCRCGMSEHRNIQSP
jgi:hypothetical protein